MEIELDAPRIIDLPKILDERGNLTFIEGDNHLPFSIRRSYHIYDVPGGEVRGGYAFKEQHQCIIALSGSFDVVVEVDGIEQRFPMNRSYYGLIVPKMHWRKIENFSTNSVCLVLSSTYYNEDDYIRDYAIYKTMKKEGGSVTECANEISTKMYTKNVLPVNVYNAEIIEFPRIGQRNGHISVLEGSKDVPFDIKRVFYLYDIPAGEDRGAHAHKECHQFLIAASGSFEVQLDDGRNKRTVRLDRPYYGLHIPPGIWASELAFSSGAICLVLTSHTYDEKDYIRNYGDFLEFVNNES